MDLSALSASDVLSTVPLETLLPRAVFLGVGGVTLLRHLPLLFGNERHLYRAELFAASCQPQLALAELDRHDGCLSPDRDSLYLRVTLLASLGDNEAASTALEHAAETISPRDIDRIRDLLLAGPATPRTPAKLS